MRTFLFGIFIVVATLSSHAFAQVTTSSNPSRDGDITLHWPSSGSVTIVESKDGANGTVAYQGGGTSVTLSGRTNGSYEYQVFDDDGGGCHPWVGCVPSSLGTLTVTVDLLALPGSPASISAPSVSSGSFNVSWSAVSGNVDHYQLQEAVNGGAWATAQSNASTSKSFSKPVGNYYDYRVSACNQAGCSGTTNVARVTVALPVPSTPGAISAPSTANTGSYTVSWGSASNAAVYELQERMNGGSWATVHSDTSRSRSFSKPAGNYFDYRARACNTSGCSGYTANKRVTIPAASVGASVSPSIYPHIPESVTLDWSSTMTSSCYIFGQALSGSNGSASVNIPITEWQHDTTLSTWTVGLVVTCDVIGGGTVDSAPVLVSAALYQQRPNVSVGWNKAAVDEDEPAVISWTSTLADRCQLDGQNVALNGSLSFSYSSEGTYSKTIRCENLGGERSASASVIVSAFPDPVVSVSWAASSAALGGSTLFSWSSSNADTCYLDGQSVALNGAQSFSFDFVGAFTKTVRCEGAGGTDESAAVLVVDAPVVQPANADPANDALNGDVYYGQLRGQHSVSGGGAFNYTVPIDAPPGINGVEPNISLDYSSSAQNGVMGWGWNIQGLSAISRCPATLIRDGYASGINAGDDYKFCLDGQRLVEMPNGEFRTESESFKRITRLANYWLVESPDGSKTYYGFDSANNALVSDDQGVPISWLIDRKSDAAGNYMTYVYQPEAMGNSVSIKAIHYTQSESGAQGQNNTIEFFYEDRDDISSRYVATTLMHQSKRLKYVEAKADDMLVYAYAINYEVNDGVNFADPVNTSRVASIEKCYGGYAACADPISFGWTSTHRDNYVLENSDGEYLVDEDIAEDRYFTVEGGEGLMSRLVDSGIYPFPKSVGGLKPLRDHGVRGDFDGDNRLEVIWVDCATPDANSCDRKVAMSAGDAGTLVVHTENYEAFDPNLSGQTPPQNFLVGSALDFNGDGLDDYYIKKVKSMDVYLSNGTTLNYSPGYSMDQSQLGVVYDTVCCDAKNDSVTKYWLYEYVFRDFNGDGLVDILRMPKWDTERHIPTMGDLDITDVSVAINNGTGFDAFEQWAVSTDFVFLNKIVSNGYLQAVDANGDGLIDLVGLDGQVGINTGSAFVADSSWREDINVPGLLPDVEIYVNAASVVTSFGPASSGTESVPGYNEGQTAVERLTSAFDPYGRSSALGDINGDGAIDLVAIREDGVYVSLSNGATFLPAQIWTNAITFYDLIPYCGMMECNTERRGFVIQDANGDGAADILFTKAWNGVWNQNASEVIALYSKGARHLNGSGFSDPVLIGSIAPYPDGTPTDVVWNQDVQRIGKPVVTSQGDLVVHLQPNFRDAEVGVTMGIPLIEVIDVAMEIGVKKHQILSVNESARRIDVDYKRLSDTTVYTQTGATDDSSTLGQNTSATYNFYGSDGSVSVLPDHSVSSAARGQSLAASISVYDGNTFATREDYHYTNRRSHRRGLGGLGFEKLQKTTTLAGEGDKLRRVEERLQEVGQNASYLLAVPAKTTECVISTEGAPGCDNHSGTRVLKRHTQEWKVRTYDDGDIARYHAYNVEEEIKTYDLTTREWLNTTSKRLFDDGVRQGCPMPASVTFDNRTVTSDVHFDAYGTPRHSVENRCDSFGVTGTHTENDNILNDTTNWCLNLTQDAKVHRWIYDDESGTTDTLTRQTDFQYHSSGPGVCQVSRKIREPNSTDNAIWLSEDYQYNDYGTRDNVQETVRAFTLDGIDYTQRSASLTETYGTDGSRTVETTNAEGHSSTQIFNAAFGSLSRSIDANDLVSDFYYDIAGRVIYGESLGVVTTYDYRTCDNCFAYNAKARHYVQQKVEGQSATRVYFDGHDRELGKRWRGLNGDFYYSGVKINVLGRVDTQTEPFGELDNTSALETSFDYDILGRPILTNFASGAIQNATYHYVDGAAAVTTTDALGNGKTQRYDALGREKSVRDALGTYVHYWHDALGSVNKVRVTAEEGREVITNDAVTHNIVFDDLGRKLQLIDPDVGTLNYRYNAFGKLTEQVNGEGQRICYFYDRLDRQIARRDNANSSCTGGSYQQWEFDRPGELGLLAQVTGYDTSNRAQSEVYTYTLDYLLPETVTSVINGESFTITNAYDIFHRPVGQTYPTGFTIQNRYNDYGHMYRTENAATSQMLWQADEDDARGNITQSRFENGVSVSSVFKANNGLLETRRAIRSSQVLQDHAYTFDDEGNLRHRTDNRANVIQNFCYDPLYRLTDQVVNGTCTDDVNGTYVGTAYAYDIHGNILRKDEITDYQYGQSAQNAGPHAVSYANGGLYIYDDAGRMVGSPLGRELQYSAFGKPTYMGIANHYETRIVYGAMQRRVEREDYDNGETTRTVYVGKQYERITNHDGSIEHRHYLGDWGIHVEETNKPSPETYNVYLTRDHIGSIASKSDNRADQTIKFHANEPWGRRQDEHWGGESYNTLSGDELKEMTFGTTRGFTDHEHLDGVGLIHMNGRVYDPVVGRFVSPDPWIQDPENSQSFNRYSYVWNNPLRYTDPTGETTTEEEVTVTGYQNDRGSSWSSGSIGRSVAGKNTPLFSVTISKDENGAITGIQIKHLPGINVKAIDIGETNAEGGERVKISYSVKNMKLSATVETTAQNLGAKAVPLSVDRKVDAGRAVDPVVAKEVAERERRIAWVGGAKDNDTEIVKGIYKKYGGEHDAYFQWGEGKKLAAWIEENQDHEIMLIGHSYGGDTAAGVVAKGHYVDHLVTVDPVGMIRPNFKKVAKYSGVWTNYNSVGTGVGWANAIATIGRAYNNSPRKHADFHHKIKLNHVDICLVHCKP